MLSPEPTLIASYRSAAQRLRRAAVYLDAAAKRLQVVDYTGTEDNLDHALEALGDSLDLLELVDREAVEVTHG